MKENISFYTYSYTYNLVALNDFKVSPNTRIILLMVEEVASEKPIANIKLLLFMLWTWYFKTCS